MSVRGELGVSVVYQQLREPNVRGVEGRLELEEGELRELRYVLLPSETFHDPGSSVFSHSETLGFRVCVGVLGSVGLRV